MRVNGKHIKEMRTTEVYLPSSEGAVQFVFRPIKTGEDFTKVMPRPSPPKSYEPNGNSFVNHDDPAYTAQLESWGQHKGDWEFLTSISGTDGLHWDTVDMAKPSTWKNWREEMGQVFSEREIMELFNAFVSTQYLTDDVLAAARESFLTSIRGRPDTQ